MGTQHLPFAVFLAYAATACVWTPMVPLTDAYALRGVARYGLDYGPLRLWGSAAFIVGALVCGLLVDLIAARASDLGHRRRRRAQRIGQPRAAAAGAAHGATRQRARRARPCCATAAFSRSSWRRR